MVVCHTTASDKATCEHRQALNWQTSEKCTQKDQTKSHGQARAKRIRENNCNKSEESEQSGNKVKPEEKSIITKMKWRRHQPQDR